MIEFLKSIAFCLSVGLSDMPHVLHIAFYLIYGSRCNVFEISGSNFLFLHKTEDSGLAV